MEAIPIKITPAAARRFLDALAESPAQPAGPHPTEADAIAYVLDTCTSAEADRIDAHLAGCDECLAWLERLFEYASAGRAYVRTALPEYPPDAPELRAVLIPLGQLHHKRPHIRQTGAEALGEIRSALAVPALLVALGDTHDDVRKFAADALGKIGSAAAAPTLTRILQQEDEDIWVRMAAAEALGRIGTPEARPVLKAVAAATDHEDLRDIAAIAARIAPASTHAVPVITLVCELLRDWVRQWADLHAPGYAPPALLAALSDTHDDVRKFAADALGKIGSAAAAPTLTRILQQEGEDIWVRMAAAEALGRIGTPEARPVLKAVAAATDHKDLRDIAALAARIAPTSTHAVPFLTLVCERLRDWVRQWADLHAPGYAPAGAFQAADAECQAGVLEYFQGETRKDLHYSLADEAGGLRISFSSRHLDMSRRLTLRAGDLAFTLELQQIGQVELSGDIRLSEDEAARWARESAWIVEWQGLKDCSAHSADGVDDEPCADIAEPNLSNVPRGKTIELGLDNPFAESSLDNANAFAEASCLENANAFTGPSQGNADAFSTTLDDNQAPTASPRKCA